MKWLDKLFPSQDLPFGRRWRLFGDYLAPNTDTSQSFLKRGLWWPFKDCGVYLHRLDRPDEDRDLHNHPYTFASLILSGGYVHGVWTPDGVKNEWIRPGQWVHMPRERFHRVQYLPNKTSWTLVFVGKPVWMIHPDTKERVHLWGFKVAGQFVDWVTYTKGQP